MSRFVRGIHELREHVGAVPLVPVVNRFRAIDGGVVERAQVRRALDRFAGVRQPLFLPEDARGLAAASLQARPLGDAAPRSPLVAAGRRLAFERVLPALGVAPTAETPRVRRPRLRRRPGTA